MRAAIWIRDDLRNAIASLRLSPGAAIHEKDLALSYGVSRTPVREAMATLAEEGLVSVFPQAGTFVARIPYNDLPEALLIRRALEETSTRLAAFDRSDDDLARIAETVERGRNAAACGDQDAFHQADEAFHAAIADASGYPGFWRLTQQVRVQVDRMRRLTLPQAGRVVRVLREHAEVLSAIRGHDPDRAVAAMGRHLGGLLDDIADIAAANPDCFDMSARTLRASRTVPFSENVT